MSQPPTYNRSTSFTNLQAANPTGQPPGTSLDVEYNAIKTTLDATLANLKVIQRDDGALANASVGLAQLSSAITIGFATPTAWLTGVAYLSSPAATVFFGGKFYSCLVSHTAGTFATDLSAGKWALIADLTAIPLVAANQISVVSDGALVSINVQSSLEALDNGKAATSHVHPASAISDSTAAGRAVLTAADVAAQQSLLGIASVGFQSGDIKQTAAYTLQSGWYWCNGATKSRAGDAPLFAAITINQTGTLANGSPIITGLSDTSQMSPGMPLSGTNIPVAATILSIDSGTQITMSANATGSPTTTVCVAPYGVGDGATTFNLPDYGGYTPVGRETMGGASATNIAQVSTTITTTSGSSAATVASAAGLFVGMSVTSAKLPSGTTVTAISGTSLTLSAVANANSAGVAARFSALRDAQTLGAGGGSPSSTVRTPNLPAYTPAGTVSTPTITITGGTEGGTSTQSLGSAGVLAMTGSTPIAATSSTPTFSGTAQGGTSAPLANVQPSKVANFIIKA